MGRYLFEQIILNVSTDGIAFEVEINIHVLSLWYQMDKEYLNGIKRSDTWRNDLKRKLRLKSLNTRYSVFINWINCSFPSSKKISETIRTINYVMLYTGRAQRTNLEELSFRFVLAFPNASRIHVDWIRMFLTLTWQKKNTSFQWRPKSTWTLYRKNSEEKRSHG